jgi:RNA polymerase sigma-70 factor (ECF subfamily)
MDATAEDALAAEFTGHRTHLLGLAYRLLGSRADAEDVVQEAWLRLSRVDRSTVADLRGWLTTVTGRLCLDQLRSARVRREAYVGPWLPEPLVTARDDPADRAVAGESVRLALLVVLDRLPPEQRVAFVLHDLFDVPFADVATTLGCTRPAARQLASRGRRAVAHDAPPPAPRAEQERVFAAFAAACAGGDLGALLAVLHPDVVFASDGGGVVKAALRPVLGADRVGRLLVGLLGKAGGVVTYTPVAVNGEPGLYAELDAPGTPLHGYRSVITATVSGGRIAAVYFVVNPAKIPSRPPRSPGP